ncbi:MAG: hypothetical protein KF744_08995 [Taibaiella sp.]|nr:hypothetical protein [Taibaiella sp.]
MAFDTDMTARVARDVRRITTRDFAIPLTFQPPGGSAVTVKGYQSKVQWDVSEPGSGGLTYITANTKKVYCSVSEAELTDAGYVTRDSNGNLITFKGHLVTCTDVGGQELTYIIQKGQSRADETVGHITFILGYYELPSVPGKVIMGWKQASITAQIVVTPDGSTQTLNNGDVIALQYALNNDGYGLWTSGTTYLVGSYVNYYGKGYRCTTQNADVVFTPGNWTEVAPKYATLTIPYLTSVVGIAPLTTFMIDAAAIQNEPYAAGTFDNSMYGGFQVGNVVTFDATVPVYSI